MTATALTSSVENQTCQGHQFTTSNYKQYDIAKKHGNPWLDATKRDVRFIASDYTIVEVKQGKKRNEHYLNLVFQHKNICDCQNTVPYSHLLKNVTFIQNVMQKGKNVINSSVDFVKDKAAKVHDFYLEHEKPIVFTLAGAAIVGGLVTGGFSAAAAISALGSVSPYAIMSNGMQTDKIIHAQPKTQTQTATTTNIPYTQPAVNVPIYDQKQVFPTPAYVPLATSLATDFSRPLGYGLTTNYPQTSSLHNTPQYQSLMANMDMTAICKSSTFQDLTTSGYLKNTIPNEFANKEQTFFEKAKNISQGITHGITDFFWKSVEDLHAMSFYKGMQDSDILFDFNQRISSTKEFMNLQSKQADKLEIQVQKLLRIDSQNQLYAKSRKYTNLCLNIASIASVGYGTVKGVLYTRRATKAVTQLQKMNRISGLLERYLGKSSKAFKNMHRDLLIESKDGLKQFRIDLNHFEPHNNPHSHLIKYKIKKNKKQKIIDERIYLINVNKE